MTHKIVLKIPNNGIIEPYTI